MQGPLAGNQQLVVAFDDWITESRTVDRAAGIAEWSSMDAHVAPLQEYHRDGQLRLGL